MHFEQISHGDMVDFDHPNKQKASQIQCNPPEINELDIKSNKYIKASKTQYNPRTNMN